MPLSDSESEPSAESSFSEDSEDQWDTPLDEGSPDEDNDSEMDDSDDWSIHQFTSGNESQEGEAANEVVDILV